MLNMEKGKLSSLGSFLSSRLCTMPRKSSLNILVWEPDGTTGKLGPIFLIAINIHSTVILPLLCEPAHIQREKKKKPGIISANAVINFAMAKLPGEGFSGWPRLHPILPCCMAHLGREGQQERSAKGVNSTAIHWSTHSVIRPGSRMWDLCLISC